MGLDVYLYHYKDPLEEVERVRELVHESEEALAEEYCASIGKSSEELTAEDWKARTAYVKEKVSEKFGSDPEDMAEKIEIDSAKYPEHMFKIGYFRSSYNSGGINRILETYCGQTLETVFPPEVGVEEEYYRKVDWKVALEEARYLKERFAEKTTRLGGVSVIEEAVNMFVGKDSLPKNSADVLKLYEDQLDTVTGFRERGDCTCYSNVHGQWFVKNYPEVIGIVMGVSCLGAPAAYLICKEKTGDGENWYEWYVQALEVVEETCEWVLGKEDPDNYILHWSG